MVRDIFSIIFLAISRKNNNKQTANYANHETRAENVCKLTPILKEKLILWIIVDANNKHFPFSLEKAFLHKRSSLLHKDIEFHVCILIVFETVAGFIECMECIS